MCVPTLPKIFRPVTLSIFLFGLTIYNILSAQALNTWANPENSIIWGPDNYF